MRVATVLVALVASLALVAAGCGGGDDEAAADPTAEWADGFCTAITTWKGAVTEATDDLSDLSSLSRDSIEEAADDIRTATSDFSDDLRALGAPETESGEQVEQAIDDFTTTLETESAEIESAIEGASGLSGILAVGQDVSASLSAMNSAFSSMLSTVREGDAADELETALENADACDDIG